MVVGLAGCGRVSWRRVRSLGSTPWTGAWGVGNLFAHFISSSGAVQPSENRHRIVAGTAAVHSCCPTSAGMGS